MKAIFGRWVVAAMTLFFPLCNSVAEEPGAPSLDKTLAPYFEVKSDDPATDRFPLKSTEVKANIAGVIADVTVTQTYKNEGTRALEALYIFPGSTNAAVYGMTMQIGERKIIAQIKKKEEAKKSYEKAKSEGKTASLLEQHRPNVFQMNVANVLPGDEVKVELNYTELLVPKERIYQFVYPTVVGPRYSNKSVTDTTTDEKWVSNPYLPQGTASPTMFNLEVHLAGGMPIKEVASTSHRVVVNYRNDSEADISFAAADPNNGNRDYLLNYRLAGDAVQSGVLLYPGENENFFAAMIEPPFRPTDDDIPARDYVFVVDVSGSMTGFPLDTSKALLKDLIGGLRSTDTFNVLLFSGDNEVLSETPLFANAENIQRAELLLSGQFGGGATELLPALKRTLALPLDETRSRSIIIITDGYVSAEVEAFDLIRNNLNRMNVFSFGIGSGVNRHLIDGLAHVGAGEPFIVTHPGEGASVAKEFKTLIANPMLTHAKIGFEGFEAYDIEPLAVPDVFADRPVIVFGKYRGEPKGAITLTGHTGKGRFERRLELSATAAKSENAALRYLWARHKIKMLGDYQRFDPNSDREAAITNLGLTYNLLTKYTSFIAVDHIVRKKADEPMDTVKQPLPLPHGVSNLAVGGEVPTGPEPGTWALMLIASLALVAMVRHRNAAKA